jgi:hypothetical protein
VCIQVSDQVSHSCFTVGKTTSSLEEEATGVTKEEILEETIGATPLVPATLVVNSPRLI